MKDYSVECRNCEGTFLVDERFARKEQCPNCNRSDGVTVLDELPESI